MRRIAAILVALGASVAVLATGTGAGGDEGTYQVRAIFDNGAFLVEGEEVRIAGANVGEIDEVTVSSEDEAATADGSPDPGKAVVVFSITDPAFQDFREDASCTIRPQSLLGEKFVECEPTQARAAGTEPPPPLDEIGEGEPGEGQLFLPIEQNGKAVDLDLVNNIMREPYADRFRLILNDLGAGLAARGDELAEIVERSNPALREANEVIGILADQNRALAQLAVDGQTVLEPLARERDSIGSFINSATDVNQATAERRAELEEGLALLPETLREVRATMVELKTFSDAGTPLFTVLGEGAPAATRATEALGPFAEAATPALISLGDASEASQAPLVGSDPLIRDLRTLANSAKPAAKNLSKLLRSLDVTGGFKKLLRFIYRGAGSINSFDNLGHQLRAFLLITNCNDYVTAPQSGCIANFLEELPARAPEDDAKNKARRDRERGGDSTSESSRPDEDQAPDAAQSEAEPSIEPEQPQLEPAPGLEVEPGAAPTQPGTGEGSLEPDVGAAPNSADGSALKMRDAELLLEFLFGDGRSGGAR